jgi:hypothetical protein
MGACPGRPGPSRQSAASVTAPGRSEQAGDLRDGLVDGLDVAHHGARGLVAGLGHDQLQRDLLVAEVGGCGVAELVEVQAAGVLLEQGPGAVVAWLPLPGGQLGDRSKQIGLCSPTRKVSEMAETPTDHPFG